MIKWTTILFTSLFLQQPDVLDYKSISVKGINWQSSKQQVIDILGAPIEKYDPEYECGGYSKDQPGIEKVELFKYSGIDILFVNDTVAFRKFEFGLLPDNFIISSNQININKNSSISEFEKAFPNSFKKWVYSGKGTFRLWPCNYCDDEIHIEFSNGYIKSMEFWSPC